MPKPKLRPKPIAEPAPAEAPEPAPEPKEAARALSEEVAAETGKMLQHVFACVSFVDCSKIALTCHYHGGMRALRNQSCNDVALSKRLMEFAVSS